MKMLLNLSTLKSTIPFVSTVSLLLLIISTIIHSSTCIMTSHPMCANTNHTVLSKIFNSFIFIFAVLLLSLSPIIYKNLLQRTTTLSIVIFSLLIYIVVSALIHSLSCLVNKPICSAIDNSVLMNIHNILLLLGSIFIIGFTQILHIKSL